MPAGLSVLIFKGSTINFEQVCVQVNYITETNLINLIASN